MKQTVEWYFDFLSPFSYFCWQWLPQTCEKYGLNLKIYPVPLGSLLNHWGIKGPGEVTPKREYLLKFALRYAQKNQIPFITPRTHPFNSLYALRLCLEGVSGDLQHKVIECIWKAGWQNQEDLGNPDRLIELLHEAGLPAQDLYEKSFLKDAKQELKKNIEQAIARGAFGVPTIYFNNELFWGNDAQEDFELFIQGKDPLNKKLFHELITTTPRAAESKIEI